MKNFLSNLYFRKFENNKKEKEFNFKSGSKFESEGEAHRNDQNISNCRETSKMLNELIDQFIPLVQRGD